MTVLNLAARNVFTTTDGQVLGLPSLFYNEYILSLRTCKVESVLLPNAPEEFYLADSLYHIISRDLNMQMQTIEVSQVFPYQHCHVKPVLSAQAAEVNFHSRGPINGS